MKAIANMNELFETLKAESNDWECQIFDATGVIPCWRPEDPATQRPKS